NRRLWYDEILLLLESDLHRSLAEEDRVVAHLGLHAPAPPLLRFQLPRLFVKAAEVGDRGARTRRYDQTGLHLLGIDRGGRQVEAHPGALIPVLRGDENPIAYDEKLLHGEFHG